MGNGKRAVKSRGESYDIRQVKGEIRVLALAWYPAGERSLEFIGVVFRGGLWLDGVLTARVHQERGVLERELAQLIRASGHYGQVRVMMAPRSSLGIKLPFDGSTLVKETGLPMIVYAWASGDVEPLGLRPEVAARIVAKTCSLSRRPEPLRVAALVASAMRAPGGKV